MDPRIPNTPTHVLGEVMSAGNWSPPPVHWLLFHRSTPNDIRVSRPWISLRDGRHESCRVVSRPGNLIASIEDGNTDLMNQGWGAPQHRLIFLRWNGGDILLRAPAAEPNTPQRGTGSRNQKLHSRQKFGEMRDGSVSFRYTSGLVKASGGNRPSCRRDYGWVA